VAPGGSSKVSPCHWSVWKLAGAAPKTGSPAAYGVSSTGSTPTSGSAPL
jgi:hypothetical protein